MVLWFYGFREDLPEDAHSLESRFNSFEKVNAVFEAVLPEILENERRVEAMKDDPSKRDIFTKVGLAKRTEEQIVADANRSAAFWITGSQSFAARLLELRQGGQAPTESTLPPNIPPQPPSA